MINEINKLKENIISEINNAQTVETLENIRVSVIGKKGKLTQILKNLKNLTPEERKEIGKEANILKDKLTNLINDRKENLDNLNIKHSIKDKSGIDITLPGTKYEIGSLNPVTIVRKEIEEIFIGMGFRIVDGPEADSEYYNFEALNVPKHHPARDMQDTYWLNTGQLLRTHTSPCQVRAMEEFGAPLRMIAPGRCFRNERTDASHENTFFQLEGMMIDENISIANLIYIMKLLLANVFKREVKIRLRPGYFPFVEPGFELDLNCMICGGKGCPTCKYSGWVEILPCGMVHPNVLKYGKIDTDRYTGFAFGLGLTRLAMMKYGIHDIRALNSGDKRILKQFAIR